MRLFGLGFVVAVAGQTTIGGFKACSPCAQVCAVPCDTPNPAVPNPAPSGLAVVWDNTPPAQDDSKLLSNVAFNLNPYNSVRPEFRDSPPSQADLAKLWQHHLSDNAYKSPFVRPMKSGLWEAGVPNRYAPSGYNRRKFDNEGEALSFVRKKTGAGSSITYDDPSTVNAELPTLDDSSLPLAAKAHAQAYANARSQVSAQHPFKPVAHAPMPVARTQAEVMAQAPAIKAASKPASFIEMSSTFKARRPTTDTDIVEKAASSSTIESDTALTAEAQATRDSRDHSSKIAHKMRDFLANYKPDHEVKITGQTQSAS